MDRSGGRRGTLSEENAEFAKERFVVELFVDVFSVMELDVKILSVPLRGPTEVFSCLVSFRKILSLPPLGLTGNFSCLVPCLNILSVPPSTLCDSDSSILLAEETLRMSLSEVSEPLWD